jgi:serine/threonine-protein kinase
MSESREKRQAPVSAAQASGSSPPAAKPDPLPPLDGFASRVDTLPDAFAERVERRQLAVGDIVGQRYRLVEVLGGGAMGQVFVAENLAIGQRVAIKVLKAELLADPVFRQRFQHEAEAIAAIAHPNVARFMDLVVGDPTFLVMEYVKGPTLAHLLKSERLDAPRAARLATRLCWGLEAAHAAGVIHRDLKPSNVIVAPDIEQGEAPKIIDFGLAKLAAVTAGRELTRMGQIVGTPRYMSPEQISGRPVDARSDVYALGCVLYEMVAGRPPFLDSEEDVQLLYRHMHEPPPPLHTIVRDVPPALEALVSRALAKQPKDRFESMAAMAQALVRAVEKRAPRPPVPAPRLSRAPLFVALGAVVIASLALVGVLHWRSSRAATQQHVAAMLLVATDPSGAVIEIDGQRQHETTPAAIPELAPGKHELRLLGAGYAEVRRTLQLGSGERQLIQLKLPPAERRVELRSAPDGARVFLDGQLQMATTPLVLVLSDDFHEVRVEKDGYEPLVRGITPDDRDPSLILTLAPEKQARGRLLVDSTATGEVFVDGVDSGLEAPTIPFYLPEGAHTVELRDDGGARMAQAHVDIRRGTTVHINLNPNGKTTR